MNELLELALQQGHSVFARQSFLTLHGGQKLSNDPYVNAVCGFLESIADREGARGVMNLPPRHCKTFLGSTSLAARALAYHPEREVMIISHSEKLAESIAYGVRQILRAPWFRSVFPRCRIAKGYDRIADFRTTRGGGLFATSVDGNLTGRGAHLLIVDDPSRIDDARSPWLFADVNERFDVDIISRLNNPRRDCVIVVAHRIAKDDLSGHLLAEGGWAHLKLPLVAENDASYDTGRGVWNRRQGELLRPDAFSNKDLELLRAKRGQPDFQTLYQQEPAGSRFSIEESDFPLFAENPIATAGLVFSVDTAQAVGDHNSASAIQVWQRVGDDHYLIDQWLDRVNYGALVKRLRGMCAQHTPGAILIEQTGVGVALIHDARRGLRNAKVPVIGILPGNRSKLERLEKVIDVVKSKHVWLPQYVPWRQSFVAEVCFRDAGSDQLDALTQYLEWALQNSSPPLQPAPSMGLLLNRYGKITRFDGRPPAPFDHFPKRL